jgi:hypothetical protein
MTAVPYVPECFDLISSDHAADCWFVVRLPTETAALRLVTLRIEMLPASGVAMGGQQQTLP